MKVGEIWRIREELMPNLFPDWPSRYLLVEYVQEQDGYVVKGWSDELNKFIPFNKGLTIEWILIHCIKEENK